MNAFFYEYEVECKVVIIFAEELA